jgi:23S rRNA pseudouridine1911/1915/1917 synthase
VLAPLLPDYSRSQISNWIKSGAITMNQKPCKPKDKTSEGDQIDINVDLNLMDNNFEHCAPEEIPLTIVFEDDELLVLNKPANMVVHPGAGNREHTLVNALLHHAPSLHHLPRAGIIHRLDKDTTGLLVIAKTLIAHTSLVRQMQAREIQRHYLALVQGHLISGGTLDTGFGRHHRNRLKMTVMEHGRQAITHYAIKKQYQDFTLLDVKLMTGRTHQIRVHLAHIHHPVVGDQLYGGRMRFPAQASDELKTQLQEFKRQALHACSLSFCHPKTDEILTLTAPLPDDFQFLLNTLDEHYED